MSSLRAVAVAALAVTATACGQGEEASGDWRADVNETCRAARLEHEELARSFPQTRAGAIDYIRSINEEFATFADDLRATRVPLSERDEFARMADEYERALRAQEELLAALEAGDQAGAAREAARVERIGNRGDAIALRLSLRECARDVGESELLERR